MNKNRLSIKVIVSLLLFFVVVIDIGTISFLTYQSNRQLIKQQVQKYYHSSINHLKDKIISNLKLIERGMSQLSKNTLLVNSIVDELGREQYLHALLKDFTIAGVNIPINICLLDFESNLIGSNHIEITGEGFKHPEEEIIRQRVETLVTNVIENGLIYQTFVKNEQQQNLFFSATPVFYEGNPEAILTATVNWDQLWAENVLHLDNILVSLEYNGKQFISTENVKVLGEEQRFAIQDFPGLEIITKIPFSALQAPILSLAKKTLLWSGAILIISLSINLIFVAKQISQPIVKLKENVAKVSQGEWRKVEIGSSSREVTELALAFNEMTSKLEASQNELELEKNKQLQSAYKSGVAENAIGVLHNIGNVITPISVYLNQLINDSALSAVNGYLKKIHHQLRSKNELNTLNQYLTNDPKGTRILPFFSQTITEIDRINNESQSQLQIIEKQVGHITDIILLQQKYANFQSQGEKVLLHVIIKDVLEMMESIFSPRNVIVEPRLESVPEIIIEKNKLVQVLINLFKNAVESIDQKLLQDAPFTPKLGITLAQVDDSTIQIKIRDNGNGADEDSLKHSFEFGFSTKERNSGFGLHDTANFIKANQGEIAFTSDGIGKGAEIVISFPLPV